MERPSLRITPARQWPVQQVHQPSAHGEELQRRPDMTPEQGGDEAWINLVRKVNMAHPRFHPTNQHTIFCAPENISQSHRAAYEPSVVCIGPLGTLNGYPRGCRKLEDCKWRFLRCLFSRCQNGNDASRILDDCLTELKSRDAEVRSCYSEHFLYINPSELATMMLLDGSFILYLLLRIQEEGDTGYVVPSPNRLETLYGSAEQGSPNLTGEEEVSIVENADKVQESRSKEQEKKKGKVMGAPESGSGSGSKPEPPPEPVVDIEIGGTENFDGSLLGSLWTLNLIVYDLLKLENQIPFFVIRLIYNKLFMTPNDDPGSVDRLMELALNLFSDIHPNKPVHFRTTPPKKMHHLLHLFHWSIVTHRQVTLPEAQATGHHWSMVLQRLFGQQQYQTTTRQLAMATPQWIPSATELAMAPPEWIPNATESAMATPEWIPSATELAMAGVKFKRMKKFDRFLDISFENGVLEIPRLRIYDYTNSLFRNLIAFEQCYPDTNTDITLYANFMDCIVDTANDVRLLNMKGILIHRLSTDDEVASLFNQLCNQVHCDPKKNYLKNLFAEVTEYHESKWHQWRAGLIRDYFSNPWVIISVLAAVLLLLLTIEQSFFTAFSYFRPPKS